MAKLKNRRNIKQEPKTESVRIYFSSEELKMLDHCIQRFKHKNRSSYIRKLVMTDVLSQLFESYPTLFEQVITTSDNDSVSLISEEPYLNDE